MGEGQSTVPGDAVAGVYGVGVGIRLRVACSDGVVSAAAPGDPVAAVGAVFDLARWDRNASLVDEQALSGRVAYGGLDLGSVSDLTALAWLFPAEQGLDVLVRLFMPEASWGRWMTGRRGTPRAG